MTDNTPVSYHYCQRQKNNTTKVEIYEADNTYIVILNKQNCNKCKTPALTYLSTNIPQNQEKESRWAFDNVRIIVSKKKKMKEKKRKKPKHRTHFITTDDYLKIMAKKCSTPDVHRDIHSGMHSTKKQRSDTYLNTSTAFRTQCIINTVTLYPNTVPAECLPLLRHPLLQAQLRIYRYHFHEKDETCCCSCNSMFNLIKCLYDCQKEKRFNHLDFFQCGHLQLEERIFSEVHETPETVLRETKDSTHINTFSAGKVFEEREGETCETKERIHINTFSAGKVFEEREEETGETKDSIHINRFSAGKVFEEGEEKTGQTKDIIHINTFSGAKVFEAREEETGETEDSIHINRFSAGKVFEEGEEKTGQTKDSIHINTFSEAKVFEAREEETGETKDRIYINTISAGKVFEETGITNLPLQLPDKLILKHTYNLASEHSLKSSAHIFENEFRLHEFCEPILIYPRLTKSENFDRSIAPPLLMPLLEKSLPKIIGGVYSLNSFIPLEYRSSKRESIIDVTKKEIGVSPVSIHLENKKNCVETEKTEIISTVEEILRKSEKEKINLSFEEKRQTVGRDDKKTSETELFQKIKTEVNSKISIKRVSSEVIIRKRYASFLIPLEMNMPEKKENLHRCKVKRSTSLQDVKAVSEKKILKRVRKDIVLFKELNNTADRKRRNNSYVLHHGCKSSVLDNDETIRDNKSTLFDDTITLNKILVDKDDNNTSLAVPQSTLANKEKIVVQLDKTTMESKCLLEEPSKNISASSMIPLAEGTKLNVTPKQKGHRHSGIPVLVDRLAARKKLNDKVKDSTNLLSLPKTTHIAIPTLSTTLNKKLDLDTLKKQGSQVEKDKVTAEEKNESEKQIFNNDKALDTTLVTKMSIEQQDNAKVSASVCDNDNSICCLYTSGVKQIERFESKSVLEKSLFSEAQGTLEQISSDILNNDTDMCTPLSEGRTCWDKVLIKKIHDELSVSKKKDVRLHNMTHVGLNKWNIKEENTIPKDKIHSEVTSHALKASAEKKRTATMQSFKQFTPLDGKTDLQKEKILRGLIGKGKPLPEGRTKAEKVLIDKVRAETGKLAHSYFTKTNERKIKLYR